VLIQRRLSLLWVGINRMNNFELNKAIAEALGF